VAGGPISFAATLRLNTERDDVLIVGGGVIGLACAHALALRGRRVRLLERGRIGAGASQGNCGLVTPSHALPLNVPGLPRKVMGWMFRSDSPVYWRPRPDLRLLNWGRHFLARCNERDMLQAMHGRAALLQASREQYDALFAANDLACEWLESGLLVVYRTQAAMHATAALEAHLKDVGIEPEELDAGEVQAREPALRDEVQGGHFFACDAELRPDALVAGWAEVVRKAGVELVEECAVEGFEVGASRVDAVRTVRGRMPAREVVIATGAWSPQLGRALGLAVPVQPGKGYTLTLPRPAICPRFPLLLKERNCAVTPWGSGLRLGGTMEFSGYRERLDPRRLAAIRASVAEYLREPGAGLPAEEWTGWRPMTWDELPILGRSPRHENVCLATGHGMLGVSMAPASGRLIAELVCGAAPHLDPAPYAPARFARGR